jgi:hypothetical protein
MPDRLKEAREKAGFAPAADAARCFGWEIPAYRHHENGTQGRFASILAGYWRSIRSRQCLHKPAWGELLK